MPTSTVYFYQIHNPLSKLVSHPFEPFTEKRINELLRAYMLRNQPRDFNHVQHAFDCAWFEARSTTAGSWTPYICATQSSKRQKVDEMPSIRWKVLH